MAGGDGMCPVNYLFLLRSSNFFVNGMDIAVVTYLWCLRKSDNFLHHQGNVGGSFPSCRQNVRDFKKNFDLKQCFSFG